MSTAATDRQQGGTLPSPGRHTRPERFAIAPAALAVTASGRLRHPVWAMPAATRPPTVRAVDDVERLLRRLAFNDEELVALVLSGRPEVVSTAVLPPRVDLLVRLGALLAVGAATSSLRATVDGALGAGATESEIVGVLIAVAPAIGLARVVSAAPRLALAIGYDIEADEDE